MRLMRWEPFREMDDLLKGFSPLFGRLPTRPHEGDAEFVPPADVVERDKEYLVKVDLPDVHKDDVKVLFDDGVLTIKGERKIEKEVKGEKVHRTERYFGMFERSFALPRRRRSEGNPRRVQGRGADRHPAARGRGEAASAGDHDPVTGRRRRRFLRMNGAPGDPPPPSSHAARAAALGQVNDDAET